MFTVSCREKSVRFAHIFRRTTRRNKLINKIAPKKIRNYAFVQIKTFTHNTHAINLLRFYIMLAMMFTCYRIQRLQNQDGKA